MSPKLFSLNLAIFCYKLIILWYNGNMNSKEKLYAEICSNFKATDEQLQQIYDAIQSYQIRFINNQISFDTAITRFVTSRQAEGLSINTVRSYKCKLTQFSKFINKIPADVSKDDVLDYLAYLSGKIRKTSINTALGIIKNFYTWAENELLVSHNPAKAISYKVSKRTRHALEVKEYKDLLATCGNLRDEALVRFLLQTGCRVSEAINIKTKDINWDKQSINVIGKGDKERTVLFDNVTKKLLRKYLKSGHHSEYLFEGRRSPYKQLTRFAVEKMVRELGVKAGIKQRVFPHKLRHTFATNALESGLELMSIAKLLGHEDVQTTQIYAEMRMTTVKKSYDETFSKKKRKKKE